MIPRLTLACFFLPSDAKSRGEARASWDTAPGRVCLGPWSRPAAPAAVWHIPGLGLREGLAAGPQDGRLWHRLLGGVVTLVVVVAMVAAVVVGAVVAVVTVGSVEAVAVVVVVGVHGGGSL